MNYFNLGIEEIDNNIKIATDELIVIGGRPASGKTSFAVNILKNNKNRGCLILLEKITIPTSENYEVVQLELPSLVELMEKVVELKNEFDYFIIDGLTQIDSFINPLFNENKNYQTILRSLRLLAKSLNKNIVLLSNLDRIIEEKYTENIFPYSYYAQREKYVDFIFVLHRPNYYDLNIDLEGVFVKNNDLFLCVAKAPNLQIRTFKVEKLQDNF